MRFAYADPPYPGCAHRYPEKREVDHAELIAMLCREFPDGWALSTHVPGLRIVLPLCPRDVRIGAWMKSYSSGIPGERVLRAWEPVLWRGGRSPRLRKIAEVGPDPAMRRGPGCCRDWILTPHNKQAASGVSGVLGAKPERFCWWLFEILGAQPGDELVDLFPGTGGVTRAWDIYLRQLSLFSSGPAPVPDQAGTLFTAADGTDG